MFGNRRTVEAMALGAALAQSSTHHHNNSTNISVTGVGAPEAARFLKELETTAESNVLNSAVLTLAPFNFEVALVEMVTNAVLGERQLFVGFHLNGEPHTIKLTQDERRLLSDPRKQFEALHKIVADYLASRMLMAVADQKPYELQWLVTGGRNER